MGINAHFKYYQVAHADPTDTQGTCFFDIMSGSSSLKSPEEDRHTPHWKLITSQSLVTDRILNHRHAESGTAKDPYVVEWILYDLDYPMLFSAFKKCLITLSISVLPP